MVGKAGRDSPTQMTTPSLARLLAFDELRSATPLDRLAVAALAYLLLPNLIFVGGWFNPMLAVPLSALAIGCLWHLACGAGYGPSGLPNRGVLAMILLFAAAWVSLGGAGHFFFANHDWSVRDAVLGDLVFSQWPPAYAGPEKETLLLRSALGFFLPAALVGKLLGIVALDWALYLWTLLGTMLFLLLLPLPRRTGLLLFICLLIVAFFSGMDALGHFSRRGSWQEFPQAIEWWVAYSYSSFSAQLFWAPNHTLPIWIVTALCYRHWAHDSFWRLMFFAVPLTLIWTPFAAAGMLPFLLLAAARAWALRLRPPISRPLLAFALVLGLVVLRFITLDLGGLPVFMPGKMPSTGSNFSYFPPPTPADYALFVSLEFGILALALLPTLRHSYALYLVAVIMLLVLPIGTLGPSKDSMMRLSVPPLIVLMILTLTTLQDWARARAVPPFVGVIAFTLLMGMPTAYYEMARAVLWTRVPPNYGLSLQEQQHGGFPPHYMGRLDRSDVLWLLKPPHVVPSSKERPKT